MQKHQKRIEKERKNKAQIDLRGLATGLQRPQTRPQ